MNEKHTVSVACTSFNRPDLLERTLRSFFKYNTYPIEQFIVLDDSGICDCNDHLRDEFPSVLFLHNDERVGQIETIDRLYQQMEGRFVFHLEEDWEFYRGGFIEESLPILNRYPQIQQVWIRAENDTNGHPQSKDQLKCGFDKWRHLSVSHNGWHGFSFNPGLRRMGDYYQHGPYSSIAKFIPEKPWVSEQRIGQYMMEHGFISAIILGKGYVRHIGNGRGIRG